MMLRDTAAAPVLQPLQGFRVIECCYQAAGSYLGRTLALLGAEVIKVEDPRTPGLRSEPPLVSEAPSVGALFAYLAAGKRSISLAPDGTTAHLLRGELAASADVFIDDRPLSERNEAGEAPDFFLCQNERLIYVSVLPFGAVGPNSEFVGEEVNTFHASGEGNLLPNGLGNEMFPEREPLKGYGHLSELQAGVGAAVATMAALFVRDAVGGQSIDISVQDVNVALAAFSLQRYGDGVLETRHTRSFNYGGVIECADGYVQLLVLEQHQWNGLVEMLGAPEWALRPEYRDPVERASHGKQINRHLRDSFRRMAVDDVVTLSRKHGIPLDRYNPPLAVLQSTHEQERKFFSGCRLPDGTEARMPNLPFKLLPAREWPDMLSLPQAVGEANERVYAQYLQHTTAEIAAWKSEGAI